MELCEALALRRGDMVALVGGGGKTTALYRLGAELSARGEPVLLCGTTRFTPPDAGEAPNLTLVEDEVALLRAAAGGPWPRTVATGWGNKGRLLPVEPAWLDTLSRERPDLTIVIEADGSAMRPFKAPGEQEPVIPARATMVVSVVGVDVVGRPLDETHVHRPERVAAILDIALGCMITPAIVATVLADPEGGRKGVPESARWTVLLNKADTDQRRTTAERIASLLTNEAERTVIAQLRRIPPVLAVWQSDSRSTTD
jgi:probable selenium-dependent hydroxylase accessory protein YqeC